MLKLSCSDLMIGCGAGDGAGDGSAAGVVVGGEVTGGFTGVTLLGDVVLSASVVGDESAANTLLLMNTLDGKKLNGEEKQN